MASTLTRSFSVTTSVQLKKNLELPPCVDARCRLMYSMSAGTSKGVEMDHDETAAARNECYCENCTDRAAWDAQDS